MIKNLKISLIMTGAFIILIIASIVLISAQSSAPKGVDKIEKLISACESKSTSRIISLVDSTGINKNAFSGCVTVDDYLSECNIDFDLSSKDTVKKVYLIGVSEQKLSDKDSSLAALEEIFAFYSTASSFRYVAAFVGVDYVDENGVENSRVADCVFAFNEKNGKIYSIY